MKNSFLPEGVIGKQLGKGTRKKLFNCRGLDDINENSKTTKLKENLDPCGYYAK
jgi:hypothetical protein